MPLFTPTNYPWKLAQEYEEIDELPIQSYGNESEYLVPSYIPNDMCTTSLKFPNLITGSDCQPIEVERSVLCLNIIPNKSSEYDKRLNNQVSSVIESSQVVNKNLDDLVRKEKEKTETCLDAKNKRTLNLYASYLGVKFEKITLRYKEVMSENKKIKDYKRKLQLFIKNIEVLLFVSTECYHCRHTEDKDQRKNDKIVPKINDKTEQNVNDNIDKLLVKENMDFLKRKQLLQEYLKQCENQLNEGKSLQLDFENLIKNVQWILYIKKSTEAIKNFFDSNFWGDKVEYVLKESLKMAEKSSELQKNINIEFEKLTQELSNTWTETNNAFAEGNAQLEKATCRIQCQLNDIKSRVLEIKTNVQYLKKNKELDHDLHEAEKQLKVLSVSKTRLELALSRKIQMLFTDDQKCMTLRKSYPISIMLKL